LQVSEADGAATYKQKLEVIEEQEELIADEKAQEEVSILLLHYKFSQKYNNFNHIIERGGCKTSSKRSGRSCQGSGSC
jgi:hypothetical protein